jgi:hypothetical protein
MMINAQELSNSFDTVLNSYASSIPYGEQASKREVVLDEYEKSLFLTRSQEDVVISLYNGKNSLGESFETTEELRRYLEVLVKTKTYVPNDTQDVESVSSSSLIFELPPDLLFITFEQVEYDTKCETAKYSTVYPVRQDEYTKIKNNPFRGANEYRVLRLDRGDNYVEIIPPKDIVKYQIKYLSKPAPIILEDLGSLSIDGVSEETTDFPLHSSVYKLIIDRAVLMALQSKGISTENS